MKPSETALLAAREIARTWRVEPRVLRHTDAEGGHPIDIAVTDRFSTPGITAYSTLGLSDHDIGLGRVRLELVAGFPSSFEAGSAVLATVAGNAFQNAASLRPDAIHLDVMSHYQPGAGLPHLLLTDPFLWPDGPEILDIPALAAGKLLWLQLVPISEAERRLADQNGVEALTALFEQRGVDVLDLNRLSVV